MIPERPEFGLYVALKVHVYERLARGDPSAPLPSSPPPEMTARKICRLVESRSANPDRMHTQYTDLFDVSTQYVRERLKTLNHGTVLLENGQGLRHANLFQWNEPITRGSLESFHHIRSILGPNLNFAIDVYRLAEAFGTRTFTLAAFLDLFRSVRAGLLSRRWYAIHTHAPATSPQFSQFLQGRLRDLVGCGLVNITGRTNEVSLTPRGVEVAHWFELFVYSLDYADTKNT